MASQLDRVGALPASLLALALGGCSSILGLDDFGAAGEGGGATSGPTTTSGTDATGTTSSTGGGATSSTGETSSSTGGGAGGAGGSGTGGSGAGGAGGGGAGPGCTALEPFEIFTAPELLSAPDDESIFAVQRPPDENRIHVAVPIDDQRIAVRTVRTAQQVELRDVVFHPPQPDGVDRRFVGAYTRADTFHVWGVEDNVPGEWVFDASPDVSNAPVSFAPYPRPANCTQTLALSVTQREDGASGFAATCLNVNNRAVLYGGATTGGAPDFVLPEQALINGNPPPDLVVRLYLRMGDQHVIFTSAEDFAVSRPFLRRGTTTAELAVATPLGLPPNESAIMVGGPTVGGRTFLAMLHADPDTIFEPEAEGAYDSGVVASGDLDALLDDAVRALPGQLTFPTLADIAPIFRITGNANGFVGGAVSNFDFDAPVRVRVFTWDEDGLPVVRGAPVFEASGPARPLVGTATRSGFGAILAAWTEDVSGAARVRGARVQCD